MHAWWPQTPRPGNFGDILTPYIFQKLTGKTLKYKHHQQLKNGDMLCVGSIIKFALRGVNVWGSGIMSADHYINPKAHYRAVRGPITRQKIIDAGGECPEVYGDPALLLPMFYKPVIVKKYKYGIVPHYVDYDSVVEQMEGTGIKVLKIIGSDIERFIDELLECEHIVSSSLHGIIAAHAYGIDAVFAKFSDKLNGDGNKFEDYFQSVGIQMPCEDLRDGVSAQRIESLDYVAPGQIDELKLLSSFPYQMKQEWLSICKQAFVY